MSETGMHAFQALRETASQNGLQTMTLEEINDEIKAARNERNKANTQSMNNA